MKTRKIVKEIDQPILKPIDRPIFEKKQEVESQITIEIIGTMTKEGQGSTILTPEQRLQYEKKQKEWKRQIEEEARREAEKKREEEIKTQYDNKILHDNKQQNNDDQEATFGFIILDTRGILGKEVKMNNIPLYVLPNFHGMST